MFNLDYLLEHHELFQYAIGIPYKHFQELLPKFIRALRKAEYDRNWNRKRIRQPGGGRKATLKTDEEKLFFILWYYKVYPTFRYAQIEYRFDKRNIQLWIRFLEKVLFAALGYELELPKRKIKNRGEWLEICPDLADFLVDSTERPIQRPKDREKQKEYYSGKKNTTRLKISYLFIPGQKRFLLCPKRSRVNAVINAFLWNSHYIR